MYNVLRAKCNYSKEVMKLKMDANIQPISECIIKSIETRAIQFRDVSLSKF